jgi:hypothetical protein
MNKTKTKKKKGFCQMGHERRLTVGNLLLGLQMSIRVFPTAPGPAKREPRLLRLAKWESH